MTATVGATLSGVTFPVRHTNLGPFQSSGGNYYFFGVDSTTVGNVEPHKASDPMSAFTAQTGKLMTSSSSNPPEALACYQVGDVIHVAMQQSNGQCRYNNYNMATDAWGLTTSEIAAAAAAQAPVAGTTFVDLVVRSGGEVVIIYCAGQTAMSSTLHMVRGARRTGVNTWTALAANIDNGGSVNWANGVAALGASDRVHFFFHDVTNSRVYQRTLTAANALQTFPASFDTSVFSGSDIHLFGNAISYVDAGTTKVRAVYLDTFQVSAVAKMDSSDAPTVTVDGGISSGSVFTTSGQGIHEIAVDGTTLHALMATTGQDLYHDSSTGGGGAWGTDVNEFTGTINHITADVFDRSGTKLAAVINDAGTLTYVEISLGAATTPISLAATSTASTLLGRSPTRKFASTGTGVPVLLRSPTRSLPSTSTGVGALTRNMPRSLPSVSTGAPALTSSKSVVRSLAATNVAAAAMLRSPAMSLKTTSASAALLARSPTRALRATSTAAPSILRSVTRYLAATSTGAAVVAIALAVQRTLAATSTAVAALRRTLNVSLPTMVTGTPSLARSTSRRLAATSTSAAVLARSATRRLGATSIGVAALSAIKSVQRVLAATSTATATLKRNAVLTLRSSSTASPSLVRRPSLALRASSTGVTVVYRGLGRRLAVTSTGAATVAFGRTLSRSLAATSSALATLRRSPSRKLAAFSSGAALLQRSALLKLEATTEALASLLRGSTINLQAYVSGLAEIVLEESTAHANASIYRLFRVLSENRFFRVLFESRLNALLLEDRTYEVGSEGRSEDIDTEVRSQGVDLESRNQNVEP